MRTPDVGGYKNISELTSRIKNRQLQAKSNHKYKEKGVNIIFSVYITGDYETGNYINLVQNRMCLHHYTTMACPSKWDSDKELHQH